MAWGSPRVLGMKCPCTLETLWGCFGVTAKLDLQRKKQQTKNKQWSNDLTNLPCRGRSWEASFCIPAEELAKAGVFRLRLKLLTITAFTEAEETLDVNKS